MDENTRNSYKLGQNAQAEGFYRSIWEWEASVNHGIQPSVNERRIIPFHFGGPSVYRAPNSIESKIHPHLTPYTIQPKGGFVAVIPYGRLWGPTGSVLSSEGKLIPDLSPEYDKKLNRMVTPEEHPALGRSSNQDLQHVPGTVASLTFCGSHNYFHWLYDVLPRFYMLQCVGSSYHSLVMNPNPYRSFVQETLSMLGISESRVIRTYDHFNIQADQLIVPSFMMNSHYPAWTTSVLRRMLLPKRDLSVITPERIYISRKKASVRKIINENEVIRCLEARGFVSLCLEDWTVAQQIQMFASAKAIVGQHGAGMSNLAFCTPGARVIEIFHVHHIVPTYWMISNHNDLHYYLLYGQTPESTTVNFPGIEDYIVDTDRLEQTLILAGLS